MGDWCRSSPGPNEGNMTGIAGIGRNMFTSKQLEKLRAAVPGARRVGVLAPANWPSLDVIFQVLEDAASRFGLDLDNSEGEQGIARSPARPTRSCSTCPSEN